MSNSDMAAASKEQLPEEMRPRDADDGNGYASLVYAAAKRVAIVGAIYLVGYMNWSVAWLITPVVFSLMRDQWKRTSDARRSISIASALANEKDVILAKITDLPSWVYFPDVERCEWVNRILQQLWFRANYFARDLVKDVIEPNVALALAGYKLPGFRFDRIILGTIAPRVGGIKVYDRNVTRNEIIMDLDLNYTSDCDISFQVAGGVRGGLKHFQIQGMVRVVMKPLINQMPLVGGLQIFFLNSPHVDFNLVGVADVLDMPGLSDMLRKIIVEQIGAIMVLPNKLPITLNSDVLASTLKMPEPEGVMRIHVIEAKDLMKKDIGMLGKGKSDPYALVSVGAQTFRTETIDSTVNPKWDFWCETAIWAENGQNMHIQLMDKDDTSDDEKLGRATIEIATVVKKGLLDTWITLEEAKHGLVHLRLSWLTMSADPKDLQAALTETQMLRVSSMSTALLTVFIDSAHNLPQARSQSKPDPILHVSCGKQQHQTAVQLRTDAPVWEQGYTFLVANPENDTVQLRIVDQKTGGELGQYTYLLSALLDKPGMQVAQQPYQLQKSGADSSIELSLRMRILKRAPSAEDELAAAGNLDRQSSVSSSSTLAGSAAGGDSGFSRTASVRTAPVSTSAAATLHKQDSKLSGQHSYGGSEPTGLDGGIAEPLLRATVSESVAAEPLASAAGGAVSQLLHHRTPSVTSTAGQAGLGRIQLTLRYSVQRQRLAVVVHRIMNIPLKDPGNIPDPYVKLYLLPGRSKESKRKTAVIRDNCNPTYDAEFEYVISTAEMQTTELEVTVATQKGLFSGGSPVIGVVHLKLAGDELLLGAGQTSWWDLLPETKEQ